MKDRNCKMLHKPIVRVGKNASGRYFVFIVINQMITRLGGIDFAKEEKALEFAKEISFGKYS